MSARALAVLLIMLAVVGAGALFLYQKESAQQSTTIKALGEPLLRGLQGSQVATINIRESNAALTVARKGDRWVLEERGGFPADAAKVREFILKAIELRIGQNDPVSGADRQRL